MPCQALRATAPTPWYNDSALVCAVDQCSLPWIVTTDRFVFFIAAQSFHKGRHSTSCDHPCALCTCKINIALALTELATSLVVVCLSVATALAHISFLLLLFQHIALTRVVTRNVVATRVLGALVILVLTETATAVIVADAVRMRRQQDRKSVV